MRILDGLMASGPWAAGAFSLADCTLLPRVVLMQKTVVPALGVPDPASGGPNLAAWWRQVHDEPLTATFVPDYGDAVDAFLARLRGG
jgi:glutathione S-transferase